MILCDLTHSYTEPNSAIRTFIDARRSYIRERTDHTHVLIIPGASDRVEHRDRAVTLRLKAPLIPGPVGRRIFTSRKRLVAALHYVRPDVLELFSWYLEPWAALSYRQQHPRTLISGHFMTDVSKARVAAPVREFLGDKAAQPLKHLADRYLSRVVQHCDLALASSAQQAERLKALGVRDPQLVKPGVDTTLFHPDRRSPALRARLGIKQRELMLCYAGRLADEEVFASLIATTREVNRCRPATLVIAGKGRLYPHLLQQQKSGAPIRLVASPDTRRELAELLATADLFITTAPVDTPNASVLEARASGLPVINVGVTRASKKMDQRAGNARTAETTSVSARQVLEAAGKREELGKDARAKIEADRTWSSTFEQAFALYETHRSRLPGASVSRSGAQPHAVA